ncbi:MAG: hypothetical protein CMP53_09455 [Flavobacteriales bacterium]|nr:hypothetical protein [Flavobacteriales bacterium]|tara:strand:+ start:2043 stop:2615 length:573 start_codon:yes stop_codon:yes gene_type:complete
MILITLPHGKANQSTHYDIGALEFLPYLERAMMDLDINYEVLVGDSHRELVDLNRKESYGTEFYNEFCKLLEESSIHLDLHSYPFVEEDAEEDDALTSMGDDLRAWSVHTAVFLEVDNVTNKTVFQNLITEIERNFDIGIFDTTVEGAFLTTVASVLFDVPSVLMEVNDQSSGYYERLAGSLAAYFVDFS